MEVDGEPELIGHEVGWLWAVNYLAARGRRGTVLIGGSGEPLPSCIADTVIHTARQTNDELGRRRLLNQLLDSAHTPKSVQTMYLDYLRRDFGTITLEGLPADASLIQGRFRLDRLYVPLQFQEYSPSDPTDRRNRLTGDAATASATASAIELGQAINDYRHLVIVGLPGSGKSTVIKKLAVAYASRKGNFNDGDGLPDEPLFPVVVRCRQLGASCREPLLSIINQQAARMERPDANAIFSKLVAGHLQRGRLFVLIDGIDEIASVADRREFAKQVAAFLTMHPTCHLVMTSRESCFEPVASLVSACKTVWVENLSTHGIEQLVHRWHDEIYGAGSDSVQRAKVLIKAIMENSPVRSLAASPLMLTTLLLVNRSMGGRLPQQRVGLYARAIEVLLTTWNIEGHEPLKLDEATAQLGYAAYRMMLSGTSSVSFGELSRLIYESRQAIPAVLGHVTMSPADFIHRIEQRTNLLVCGSRVVVADQLEHSYEFKHLSFQEYLAAVAVTNGWVAAPDGSSDLLSLLGDRLSDPVWQEVISQATVLSGIKAAEVVTELVRRLKEFSPDSLTERLDPEHAASLEPAAVLCANLVTCLRDEAHIPPSLAEEAMRVVLDYCGLTSLVPPSPGKCLHGGRYDARIRELAFAAYQISHSNPIPVAGEIAYLAYEDCQTACDHYSQYDEWVQERLTAADESQQIYGASAAFRIAFDLAQAKLPVDLQLDGSSRHIFEAVSRPEPPADRLLLIQLWAAAWLIRSAAPDDLDYLNNLQVNLARLSITLQQPGLTELERMAAWTLSNSPPAGSWTVNALERDTLLANARRHSVPPFADQRSGLHRVRTRSGFLVRRYLEVPADYGYLLEDLGLYRADVGRPDPVVEGIRAVVLEASGFSHTHHPE
jgi:hypothetical protein